MITSSSQQIKQYTDAGFWDTKTTLHSLLQGVCIEYPDLLAVADQPTREHLTGSTAQRLSYQDLDNSSTNLALLLLEHGIKTDDIVVVQLPNICELVVTYLAISKIGAIISPLPVQYSRHELDHVNNALAPAAYISISQFKQTPLLDTAQTVFSNKAKLFAWNADLKASANPTPLQLDLSQSPQAQQRLNQQSQIDPNQTFTICWTSGTTGEPKGVPRSHNMWTCIAHNTVEAGGYGKGDRLLNAFPMVNMAYISAFLYGALISKSSVILHHPIDVPVYLQQVQDEKINFTIAPPALLNQLAKSEQTWQQFDYSQLNTIGSGSTPLSPWMVDTFENHYGKKIINFYGSNEGISLFSTPDLCPDPALRASLFPRFGSGNKNWQKQADKSIGTCVLDQQSRKVIIEADQIGELAVKGPTVFNGYYNSNDKDVFTEDGFFLTGDLVEISGPNNDYYRIVGRCKDIINRGGVKISPSEIDIVVQGYPSLEEAAVCAYPDERLSEKICLCIVIKEGSDTPSLQAIKQYLEEQGLAKFKQPEKLEIFASLPHNALGKVQRFVLQEQVLERMKRG